MKINGKQIEIDKLTEDIYNDKTMTKMRGNGIYLSDNEVEVLKKYNIDYNRYGSLASLIFDIESILNEESDIEDLEEVSRRLAELNYYNNTKK